MPIYEVMPDSLRAISQATFRDARLREREDLQRLLRAQIDVLEPNLLVIAEEFSEWADSNRRIDLLALDKSANLVVIELKRTEDGGHMELQSIRYAGMVSSMTFDRAVEVYATYLERIGQTEEAEKTILSFLEWDEPDEDSFAQDVRIILVSAEFSREITSAVLWLNQKGLDIRCFRLVPYLDGQRTLIDVQAIIPLPEAEDFQVRLKEKHRKEQMSRSRNMDYTKFDLRLGETEYHQLSKRTAMFRLCEWLVSRNVSPESIVEIAGRSSMFISLPGEYDSESFIVAMSQQYASEGKEFDSTRYFCRLGELMKFKDRTFALTNQWGRQTETRMIRLQNAFEHLPIDIRRSNS